MYLHFEFSIFHSIYWGKWVRVEQRSITFIKFDFGIWNPFTVRNWAWECEQSWCSRLVFINFPRCCEMWINKDESHIKAPWWQTGYRFINFSHWQREAYFCQFIAICHIRWDMADWLKVHNNESASTKPHITRTVIKEFYIRPFLSLFISNVVWLDECRV